MQEAQSALVQGMQSLSLPNPQQAPAHSNLYVNNISLAIDEAELQSLFAAYGTIESIRLVRNSRLAAKSFGFVKFTDVSAAAAAIRGLNQAQVGGQVLEVKLADADAGDRNPELKPPPSDNLYCKNLPPQFTEEELHALFSPYGTVVESRLLHKGEPHQRLGTGALVRLGNVADAGRAIAHLHNLRLPDASAPLVVRYADTLEQKARRQARQQRQLERGGYGHGNYSQHHPHHFPSPLTAMGSGFSLSPSPSGEMRLHGSGGSGALPPRANSGYGGVPLHDGGGSGGMYALLQDPRGGPGGHLSSSVYIKHLPEQADKLFLYEKFAPFGGVLSVKVLLNEATGLCKGVGFVNYATPEEAMRAVQAMHGMPLGEMRLHVALQTHRNP